MSKTDFITIDEACKNYKQVTKVQLNRYVEDRLFPKGTVFYENGIAYILKGIVEDYSWFMQNRGWIIKTIQNRITHLLSKGMTYSDIGNGVVEKSTIRGIHLIYNENSKITFRTFAKLTSKETNFGMSARMVVSEAKDLKEYGSKTKYIFEKEKDANSIATIGDLCELPEVDIDKDVLTKAELKKDVKKQEKEVKKEEKNQENDDPWEIVLYLQNEISELKTRVEDLEVENRELNKGIAELRETKKDKRRISRLYNRR